MQAIEILGLLAGFLTAFSTVPQSIKIIREKDSANVSTVMLIMLTASYALWLIYGITLNLISIIIWNIVALAFGVTTLTLKFFIWPSQKRKQNSSKDKQEHPVPAE